MTSDGGILRKRARLGPARSSDRVMRWRTYTTREARLRSCKLRFSSSVRGLLGGWCRPRGRCPPRTSLPRVQRGRSRRDACGRRRLVPRRGGLLPARDAGRRACATRRRWRSPRVRVPRRLRGSRRRGCSNWPLRAAVYCMCNTRGVWSCCVWRELVWTDDNAGRYLFVVVAESVMGPGCWYVVTARDMEPGEVRTFRQKGR